MQLQPPDFSKLMVLIQFLPLYAVACTFNLCLYIVILPRTLPLIVPPYASLELHQCREWVSNICSMITASICGVGSIVGLFLTSQDQKFYILEVLTVCLTGYWLCDTFFRLANLKVLKKPKFQYFLIFHHLLGLAAIQITVLHVEMLNVKLLFIFMELGSILINFRFCLIDLKVDKSSLMYESVSIAMTLTFFVTRLVPVPYMLYVVFYQCFGLDLNCTASLKPYLLFNAIIYVVFTLLNIYWFYIMLAGSYRHYRRKSVTYHV